MDDVEVNLLRHVAGAYDAELGQLCSRCGIVLDHGNAADAPAVLRAGFEPGSAVMVAVAGNLRVLESSLRADRDRSDEADCASVL